MAYGGGTFSAYNKALPGAYINFVSAKRPQGAIGDRGTVAIAMAMPWGEEGAVLKITREDAYKHAEKLFGFEYGAPELMWVREIFRNAKTLLLYRLNTGAAKASCIYCNAKCGGERGNAITVRVKDLTDGTKEVSLIIGGKVVEKQTATNATQLKASNYVDWNTNQELTATAATPLTGGTNGTVTGESHQNFLNLLESYAYNALGLYSDDDTTKKLYAAYIRRMREDVGIRAQLVLFAHAADYEGVVNVKNTKDLVFWALGAVGGCAVEKSLTNRRYDGEYVFKIDYTQRELEDAIDAGEFVLHRVGDETRVLTDINSLVTVADEKRGEFKKNQVVRVLDQMATDISGMFLNRYLGKIANSAAGRTGLWSDIVTYNSELAKIGAIEAIDAAEIVVEQGETRESVVITNPVTPLVAMEKLYMTVVVM